MTYWGGLELDSDQRHWAGWRMHPRAKPIKLTYYLAAGIFLLSLVVALI